MEEEEEEQSQVSSPVKTDQNQEIFIDAQDTSLNQIMTEESKDNQLEI